jgi:hypothetical protein
MTFFVDKKLALGRIRFGLSTRQPKEIDSDPTFSTGPNGEFVRRRSEGYFFADEARFDQPSLGDGQNIAAMPFWAALKPDSSPLSYATLALLPIGLVITVFGLVVLIKNGLPGIVLIILGLALLSVPIVITAQKRARIREQEDRERAAREAEDKRNREVLGSYMTALEALRSDRSDTALAALERERGGLELPYEAWAPVARRTILQIAFDELARGSRPAKEVAVLIEEASDAAGMSREDAFGIKEDVFETILWHFLADRRLGTVQEEVVDNLRKDFRLAELPLDASAIEQLRRIRNVGDRPPQRDGCGTELGFQEHCVHETGGDDGAVHITNKRLVISGNETADLSLQKIYDVHVDVDDSVVTVKSTDQKKPIRFRVNDPLFTAALVDLVSSIDHRPKSFQ